MEVQGSLPEEADAGIGTSRPEGIRLMGAGVL